MQPMAAAVGAAWVAVVWVLWLDLGWFGRLLDLAPHGVKLLPPWPHAGSAFWSAVMGLAGAVATALLVVTAGIPSLRWLGWRRHRSSARPLIAAGAGIPVVALGAQAIGLAGLFYPALLAAAAALAAAWRLAVALRRKRSSRSRSQAVAGRGWHVRAAVASAVVVVLAALAPEVAWDAAVYHLRTPEAWALEHRITPPWGIPHAFFPFNGEMVMSIASSIGGHRAAKLLHVAAWGGCAALVARLAVAWGGPVAGPWAAAVFITAPLGMVIASRAYIEFFMTLPILGAAWLIGRRTKPPAAATVAVAGWLAGAAMGAKYQGALPAAVIGCAMLLRVRRRPASAAVYAGMAAVAAVAWGLRNLFWTGNPVFPALFGGLRFTPEDLSALEADAAATTDRIAALARLPWILLGADENDGGWGPALLAVAILPVLYRPVRGGAGWVQAGALMALWFVTAPVLRFMLPGYAIGSAAAGATLATHAAGRLLVWSRGLAAAGVWTAVLAGLTVIHESTEPFGAAVGKWSDREYIARRIHPDGWQEMLDRLAPVVPAHGRVYCMGHPFGLGVPFRAWTDLPYLRPQLYWWTHDVPSSSRLAVRARQSGLTHVTYNPGGAREMFKDRAAGLGWTPVSRRHWAAYWRGQARPEASVGAWRIWRLDRMDQGDRAGGVVPGLETPAARRPAW